MAALATVVRNCRSSSKRPASNTKKPGFRRAFFFARVAARERSGVVFFTKSSSGFASLRKRSENDTRPLPRGATVGCGASRAFGLCGAISRVPAGRCRLADRIAAWKELTRPECLPGSWMVSWRRRGRMWTARGSGKEERHVPAGHAGAAVPGLSALSRRVLVPGLGRSRSSRRSGEPVPPGCVADRRAVVASIPSTSVGCCPGHVGAYSSNVPWDWACERSRLFHDAILIGQSIDYQSAPTCVQAAWHDFALCFNSRGIPRHACPG